MPTFLGGGTQIYTADGKHLSSLPGGGDNYRTIGTTLFAGDDSSRWQSFDILTGHPGPTCDIRLGVPSDGTTLIWLDTDTYTYFGVDITTCHTVWQSAPNTAAMLRKAGTTLIQTNDDTINGLQAPA